MTFFERLADGITFTEWVGLITILVGVVGGLAYLLGSVREYVRHRH